MRRIYIHVHHHRWFYTALLIAVVVWFFSGMFLPTLRLFAAGDAFYLSYLILIASLSSECRRPRYDVGPK